MNTPREIEDRFEEAATTLRRLPNPPGSTPRSFGRSWPEYVHEAKHAYGYEEARMRVIPSAAEIQRMEEAIEWLRFIGGDDERIAAENRRIVWMRAEGHRWRKICIQIGCVRSTAWRRWSASLLTIANHLNKKKKTAAKAGPRKGAADESGAKPDETGAGPLI